MGPLTSAEFVNTIYQEAIGGKEQEAPSVVLISDPAVPDRTEFFGGQIRDVAGEVDRRGRSLGVNRGDPGHRVLIVCCMTIHPTGSTATAFARKGRFSLRETVSRVRGDAGGEAS
jgi:hypothetical protein